MLIFLNCLWLAYEVSENGHDLLIHADVGFQVVEHVFCAAFVIEWVVRFLAFRDKRAAMHDSWFLFDSVLVGALVLEVWVLSLFILITNTSPDGGMISTSMLRFMRVVRVTRAARIGRLFRTMPEIMLMVKSLLIVCRTVSVVILVLVSIVYIFAIVLTQLAKG